MSKKYQRSGEKSKRKLEVVVGRELAVRLPLPLVEVWEELQAEVDGRWTKEIFEFLYFVHTV